MNDTQIYCLLNQILFYALIAYILYLVSDGIKHYFSLTEKRKIDSERQKHELAIIEKEQILKKEELTAKILHEKETLKQEELKVKLTHEKEMETLKKKN